jgi:hypothetical protein
VAHTTERRSQVPAPASRKASIPENPRRRSAPVVVNPLDLSGNLSGGQGGGGALLRLPDHLTGREGTVRIASRSG